eukprot:GHVQ01034084.1.p1 GENE.GHVQ01034084.1~~GHVQ01034084.1.p1  ORF type:complete len:225 (-),score=25.70 GHVQ01034084.1:415-1089(-)
MNLDGVSSEGISQRGLDWLRSIVTDAEMVTTHTMAVQRISDEICAADGVYKNVCIRAATQSRTTASDFGDNLADRSQGPLMCDQLLPQLATPWLEFAKEIDILLSKLQNTPNNTDKTEAAGGATASVAAVDTLASMNRWIRGDPFARRHVYLPNDGTNNDPDECSRRYMYRVIPPYPDAQDRSESIYEDVIMTYTKGGESIKIYTPLDCPIINVASPPGPAPQG